MCTVLCLAALQANGTIDRAFCTDWSTCTCCLTASCCAEGVSDQSQPDAGTCTEVVSADRLVQLLHERAQAAVDAGSSVRALQVSCVIAVVGGLRCHTAC